MTTANNELATVFASFEDCCFQFQGRDAWRARRLMPHLGYATWRRFRDAITRAWESCEAAGIDPNEHFFVGDGSGPWTPSAEVIAEAGNNPLGGRPSEDVILSRRAAFLVVMNGDPKKPEIAFGQHYFAVSTRTLEVIQQRLTEDAHIRAREKLTETESKFQGALDEHDVSGKGIGRIRSAGDAVLFGGKDTEAMKEA